MIISASRRTDIPSYYSEWFFNRIKEEYVYVRNPMNFRQVQKISLSPSVVDGMVIWTKNPIPMMDRLEELEKYHYYFQITLTSYGRDVEPNLPSKNRELIPAFCELSRRIGRERVVWRYDPIFFNEKYSMEYHKKYFKILASKLGAYTEKCTVSFLDFYKSIQRNMQLLEMRIPAKEEQRELLTSLSQTAKDYGITLDTCAEEGDFGDLGVGHAHCIDRERLERIGNYHLDVKKDVNQRAACGCIASVDIGTYNTCKNGCVYCYANHSKRVLADQIRHYDPQNPLLFGTVGEGDAIKERMMVSLVQRQLSFPDLEGNEGNVRVD